MKWFMRNFFATWLLFSFIAAFFITFPPPSDIRVALTIVGIGYVPVGIFKMYKAWPDLWTFPGYEGLVMVGLGIASLLLAVAR